MLSLRRMVLGGAVVGLALIASGMWAQRGHSQPPAEPITTDSNVPTDQTYTGAKQCSSCHFKQYMSWKKTKHAKEAFESVPAKYKADPECIKCHTTGYGAPTGYKDASTPNLAGVTCEACHGPGSKHEEVAKQFANKKQLAPEEEKAVRGSIYKVMPQNVCVRCHGTPGHKEHPKYDKE